MDTAATTQTAANGAEMATKQEPNKRCSVHTAHSPFQGLPTFLTRLTTQTRNKQTGKILALEAQPWCMCRQCMTPQVTREGVLDLGSGEE